MKKIFLILIGIILILIYSNYILEAESKPKITINNKTFELDIAKTDEERTKGLSTYKELPKEKGMLFIFQESDYYTFWMKDMKFPIDILYINKDKVVDIFENVKPPTSQNEKIQLLRPKEKADYVLEINAGLSKKYNLKVGDKVNISL